MKQFHLICIEKGILRGVETLELLKCGRYSCISCIFQRDNVSEKDPYHRTYAPAITARIVDIEPLLSYQKNTCIADMIEKAICDILEDPTKFVKRGCDYGYMYMCARKISSKYTSVLKSQISAFEANMGTWAEYYRINDACGSLICTQSTALNLYALLL